MNYAICVCNLFTYVYVQGIKNKAEPVEVLREMLLRLEQANKRGNGIKIPDEVDKIAALEARNEVTTSFRRNTRRSFSSAVALLSPNADYNDGEVEFNNSRNKRKLPQEISNKNGLDALQSEQTVVVRNNKRAKETNAVVASTVQIESNSYNDGEVEFNKQANKLTVAPAALKETPVVPVIFDDGEVQISKKSSSKKAIKATEVGDEEEENTVSLAD